MTHKKPNGSSSDDTLWNYIFAKYSLKKFSAKGVNDPVSSILLKLKNEESMRGIRMSSSSNKFLNDGMTLEDFHERKTSQKKYSADEDSAIANKLPSMVINIQKKH